MIEELNNEFPWLIFSIHEEVFAVNSKYVASIVHKNEEVLFIPHEHSYVKGLITFRGKPIKLIDTRQLLNKESIEVEVKAFNDMIDQRKEDHIRWVNELERCAHCGDEFKLATDPHKCAFGKWYDNFETDILTISFHMGKIEEPHRLLHASALAYNKCEKMCDSCERVECLKTTVERAKNEYVTEILEILDEAKDVFKDFFKEMIITIEVEDNTFGFLVDEVIAVEELEIMNNFSDSATLFRSKFFNGVAKQQKSDKLILLLNIYEMLKLQESAEITHEHLLSLAGNDNESKSTGTPDEISEELSLEQTTDETEVVCDDTDNSDIEAVQELMDDSVVELIEELEQGINDDDEVIVAVIAAAEMVADDISMAEIEMVDDDISMAEIEMVDDDILMAEMEMVDDFESEIEAVDEAIIEVKADEKTNN